ncbi:MAG: InlB B-repeat-containing protein, partial [Clostridia bacterium]|nr:InlB B-repeat-containing protein [Clostridia bacterium]
MKKRIILISILLAVCVACTVILVACSQEGSGNNSNGDSQNPIDQVVEKTINIYETEDTAPYPFKTTLDVLGKPDVPFTKVGYEIDGYQDVNGVRYQTYSRISDGLNLYVVWKPIIYTIKFKSLNPDGTVSIKQSEVKNGEFMPLFDTPSELQGYTFEGWFSGMNTETKQGSGTQYADNSDWDERYLIFNIERFEVDDGNVVQLYAGYKEIKYSVSLIYNDTNYPVESILVRPNTDISSILEERAIDTGEKKVVSWCLNNSPSQIFNGKVVENDTVIYAVWKRYAKLLTELNGGDSLRTILVYEGDSIELPIPTRYGYIFDGWYDNASFSGIPITTNITYATANHTTYYAKWIKQKYTIIFEGSGANGKMANVEIDYDPTYSLPKNAFINYTYNFVGWSLEKNGAIKYKDCQKLNFSDFDENNTMKLFAIWKPIEFTWVNNETKKIKRDGKFGQALQGYDVVDLTSLNSYMNDGYYFLFNVTLNAREQDDAYQEVGLYNKLPAKTTSTNFDENTARARGMVYWQTFEHGSGRKDTSSWDHNWTWRI